MEKLPKKEDLLPKQPPQASTPLGKDSDAVKTAKDEAEIASAENKKIELGIKTKLLQQGYQSLEEAQKDIAEKKQDAERILKSAQEIEESAIKIKEEAEKEKQKAIHALEILKQRTEQINLRFERAIQTENTFKEKDSKYTVLRDELLNLIEYHRTNISPCVKSLRAVSKSIYAWIDLLNTTGYDFTVLYNYIGKVTRVIDRYVDHIPMSISHDIIPEEDNNETQKGWQEKG